MTHQQVRITTLLAVILYHQNRGSIMFLGIDLGKTSFDGVALDPRGEVIGRAHLQVKDEVLLDPKALWEAFCKLIQELLEDTRPDAGPVECLGVCGGESNALFLNRSGEQACRTLSLTQKIAAPYADYFEATARRSRAITGQITGPNSLVSQLLYYRDTDPQGFGAIEKAVFPKDYLVWRLTGRWVTDVATASTTCLFDPVRQDWSQKILQAIGLKEDLLPSVERPDEIVGTVQDTCSQDTGLGGVQVITGACANVLQAVSAGCQTAGSGLLQIGDTAQVLSLSDTFLPNPLRKVEAGAYVLEGLFCETVKTGPAGLFREWANHLGAPAGSISQEGANEIYFIPNLEHGGLLAGLSPMTTPGDIALGVLYGVAFEIVEAIKSMEALEELGRDFILVAPEEIGRSWAPYLASALNRNLRLVVDDRFLGAKGAALMGRGAVSSLSTQDTYPPADNLAVFEPQSEASAHFEEISPRLAGLKSRLTHA
jgi:xylulokinase